MTGGLVETDHDGTQAGPIHRVCGDTVVVDVPGLARVVLEAGDVVDVTVAPEAEDGDLDWLLQGHVRGVASLQQGQMALRASGVVIDGQAVAICAPGAIGASAVAAGLAARGHQVLADGWLPVSEPDHIVPAVTRELALWPDVAEMVGRAPGEGRPVRPGLAKAHYRFSPGDPSPIAAVVVLRRFDWEEDERFEAVEGASAVEVLHRFIAADHLIRPLGMEAKAFFWTAALASRCQVHSLDLDRDRPGIEQPAIAIERMLLR